ncbi:preprotein translocase subunit SecY [Alicyclobacillus tolerans]|uniref:Protein translocase subunit SecY n=2 Tax=Alicyclobacillus tolerans TaxID=90970 RepID=A0A1M6VH00_9BACL|nr:MULTISPECIES: preprotein translocase subunit SecY [Alicyclobacillus]MDP9728522.1 preprotein translocase subunit SecY [Alicyclobacillus tengchongensis]QRF22522.1 preprotein translocase subunit SecY [Alicyclobacillus sp. TC]SHK80827.1 protein translocase subunit secY/sec61 alpha [Alicyclobacillus montanus]
MGTTIANLWRLKHLRNRILFTLFVLAVYRIGSYIPIPGINLNALTSGQNNALFNLLNMFSGGAFYRFSIFAMSVTPYITASIIVQLLQSGVVARFEEWQKEGESGRQKLTQVTRYLTVVFGLLQAGGLTFTFAHSGLLTTHQWWGYITIVIVLTAGDILLMWFGEMITEKGVGNGISILIFVGIISQFGQFGQEVYSKWFVGQNQHLFLSFLRVAILLIGTIILFAVIVYVQQAERRIPVQYAKRVVGRTVYSGQQTHIPLKVNAAGVIPVIFAVSLLILPYTIATYFQGRAWSTFILRYLYPSSWWFIGLEVLLIIAFTFFYTHVQINPQQLAEQLQKHAGYIPGVRPGAETEAYIVSVVNRITVFGSLFLGVISVLPFVLLEGMNLQSFSITGTSLLIIVGVSLQTLQQLEGQLLQRNYRGFIRQ